MSFADVGPSNDNDDGNSNDDYDDHPVLLISTNESVFIRDKYVNDNSSTQPLLGRITEFNQHGSLYCKSMKTRYVIAIWAFFGFFCGFTIRVNLSVAIVAMVSPQSLLNESRRACPSTAKQNSSQSKDYEFDWSPPTQGFILGAFFYGYMLTQV
ncbi:unnamed protein product [Didymodactylos carnosus]|uniref:Uncharacterized protein n=1 Tax=Didymodactylos carnosus TaxID=1234261 RepID=A0A8S2SJD8_9BILA|nr:unnamed protein product [Didymodactylos carnosus]CAF4234180.1 unnamed protein product [Didymodactylos carnosus]